MLHEKLIAASEVADPTMGAREGLSEIVANIDARFVKVGTILATAVEAIGRVVGALGTVGSVFQEGDAAAAVGSLTRAAERLFGVSSQLAGRTAEIGAIRSASKRLCEHAADVRRSLEVLQIYGMNVKIAAAGAEAFVDFADRMKQQLLAGEVEVSRFDEMLKELESALATMEESDRLLAFECGRVVPQVPERLIADARDLLTHQNKLAVLATETSQLASAIQGDVGSILGAIQIGDIVRQRLEHILAGCALMEARLSDSTPEICAGTRHHMTQMFVAQLIDTAADFQRETELLVGSLRRLGPQAAQLLAIQKGSAAAGNGHLFLRSLEAGLAEADAISAQLRRVDRQAAETVRIIVDTVDGLALRALAFRTLRIDVQHMSVNIELRCRKVEGIGRPVSVIANEIRNYSEKMDTSIHRFSGLADELNAISVRMRDGGDTGDGQEGDDLGNSLDAIRNGARVTEEAMASAGSEASEILAMLQNSVDQLEASLDLSGTIGAIAAHLLELAGPEAPLSDDSDHPVRLLMTEIGKSYTMAREREIHDQFRLPDMASIAQHAEVAKVIDDDDDSLFDDALF